MTIPNASAQQVFSSGITTEPFFARLPKTCPASLQLNLDSAPPDSRFRWTASSQPENEITSIRCRASCTRAGAGANRERGVGIWHPTWLCAIRSGLFRRQFKRTRNRQMSSEPWNRLCLVTAARHAPQSLAELPAYQDRHPAKARRDLDRRRPHSWNPRPGLMPWQVGDAPWVRLDRSA